MLSRARGKIIGKIGRPPANYRCRAIVARRPEDRLDDLLARRGDGPVVVLEAPTHLGNVGAAVRVAAAAGGEQRGAGPVAEAAELDRRSGV